MRESINGVEHTRANKLECRCKVIEASKAHQIDSQVTPDYAEGTLCSCEEFVGGTALYQTEPDITRGYMRIVLAQR